MHGLPGLIRCHPPVPDPGLKPTIVIPDPAPLIHLAAAEALHVLNGMGRVVLPDIIVLETTADLAKPYAAEIATWIERGTAPGSNQPVEVAETEIGSLYRLALEQNRTRPRHAGEIGIATWLADNLAHTGGPALVVYENGRVPNLLAREGVAARVAIATTRSMLAMAQDRGIIPDAEALWARILAAAPTANPAIVTTIIDP